MKTIGIKEFEKLVKDRLKEPQKYSGNTLLLWNGKYTQDSIAYRIIKQSCINNNIQNSNDQVWLAYSDYMFDSEDYTSIQQCCDIDGMYGMKNRGILFNTGCCMKDELDSWLYFINTHKNSKGHLSKDWALIACAQADAFQLKEDIFSNNCEIVTLQPDLEEWAQWGSKWYDNKVLSIIVTYMRKSELTIDYLYWGRIIDQLEKLLKKSFKELKDIPEHDFDIAIGGIAPSFPTKELYEFIHSSH